jgi:hypothetical protein
MSTVPAATTVFDSAGMGDPAFVMGRLSAPLVRPFFVVVRLVQRVDDILLVAVNNYVVLFLLEAGKRQLRFAKFLKQCKPTYIGV